ncbi:MAG TPA: sigma-70 family RNA polymerase sigma factor [Myxococcota bacterium]|nr:sigma-70 family RNA polymerase sigma factor [Myxococcota bacterium]
MVATLQKTGSWKSDPLRGAQAGDLEAFARFIEAQRPAMLRAARRYLSDTPLAEDCVQQTVLDVYGALPRYQAKGKAEHFLWRVLSNNCRDELRRQRRAAAKASAVRNAQAKVAPSPELAALDDEARARLHRALTRLSGKLREVIDLRYRDGLSQEEVAARLAIPLGTLKSRHAAALSRLRKAMLTGTMLVVGVMGAALALQESERPTLQARDGGLRDQERWTGITVYSVDGTGELQTLDGMMHVDDALAVAYVNHGLPPFPYLYVYAVDGAGQMYWYYPAYEVGDDPEGRRIEHALAPRLLHEQIRHGLRAGPLTLHALFTQRALHVSDIERGTRRDTWGKTFEQVLNIDVH